MGIAGPLVSAYIEAPTIAEGMTISEYRLGRPRKRSWLQRLWRRLNGQA